MESSLTYTCKTVFDVHVVSFNLKKAEIGHSYSEILKFSLPKEIVYADDTDFIFYQFYQDYRTTEQHDRSCKSCISI